MRTLLALLALLALVVGGVALLAGRNSEEPRTKGPSLAQAQEALAGAPPPLAALHEQGSELLEGGPEAFEDRLRDLRGYPIVVNKWGSWCGPCRLEFPHFQRQAIEHGKRVAFLGVDGVDPEADAMDFLDLIPVAFPSYKDPDEEIASVIEAAGPYPQTVFYDRRGEIVHVKAGPYESERELDADIERYALR